MKSKLVRLTYRVFLLSGVVLLTWAAGHVAYAKFYQHQQSWKFEHRLPIPPRPEAPDLQAGELVGRLQIPQVGISAIVMQGVEENILSVAAGHVSQTPLPGTGGNSAIAAHRDGLFRNLKDIHGGDSILIETVQGNYRYTVTTTEIVDPEDIGVLQSKGYSELTLITCYPFYFVGSAPQRFIVHARLNSD